MAKVNDLRILIVAENASLNFGGEAALPLHYFRVLRKRNIETWLIVHERTRHELESLFPQDIDRIYFIPDMMWHRIIWRLSKKFPARLSHFTFGFVLRLMTQLLQRRIARQVIQKHQVQVVHQPIPVSPREPSIMFDVGAPVVIGPMNGDMNYPPAFNSVENYFTKLAVKAGRFASDIINRLMPGKAHAAVLLVANQRTKAALPESVQVKSNIFEIVENGVDMEIWKSCSCSNYEDRLLSINPTFSPTRFVFVGRLVDWKAVNFLLDAFKIVINQVSAELEIIGEGPERAHLESQASRLGLLSLSERNDSTAQHVSSKSGAVYFSGWLPQSECAERLKHADVFILPSLLECGGAVVLEAMAMKLPVIATNWGGPIDYVDASCGILIDPTSEISFVNGLAQAMIALSKHPEQRVAMGQSGYERVSKYFDWESKVDSILNIYQNAITVKSKSLESVRL